MDNGTVIGYDKKGREQMHSRLLDILRDHGFIVHEVEHAAREQEVVGLVIKGGRHLEVYPRPKKFWKLYLALEHLISRVGTTGKVMQKVVGHIINQFRLASEAMAAVGDCYRFIRDAGPTQFREVLRRAPRAPLAALGDSSDQSYSLSLSRAGVE